VAKKEATKGRKDAEPKRTRARRRARSQRTTTLLRWCFVGVVVFVGFLYYRPLATYFETRATVNARAAEVRELERLNAQLEQRVAESETLQALSREARRSGLVRPGERLFIVKGIEEWRRARRESSGSTMRGDG
jgi:cell division protein FtsB